ncbi:MAG: HAD family hydrolase [Chloroflexi bacterium]|nr:HAD family hydrolase [Chloroflexota bacterium]
MHIQAISFDIDGTLLDFDTAMKQSLAFVLEELQRIDAEAAAQLSVSKLIETREQVEMESAEGHRTLEELRLESFRVSLKKAGRCDDSLAARLNGLYIEHRYACIEAFADVVPTVMLLRRKFRVGLVSNGNSFADRCGLEGLFDFELYASRVGVQKPQSGIFELAASEAGCVVQHLLHVGDCIDNDVLGALEAGAQAIWLNRDGAAAPNLAPKVRQISSLAQLLDLS